MVSCLLTCIATYAQKTITIAEAAQTVPAGKKWVIPIHRKVLVGVPGSTLQSGTLCNATLLTKNASIGMIGSGPNPYSPLHIYKINISTLEPSAFSGNNVISVTPESFTWKSFEDNSVTTLTENLVFYQNEIVHARECMRGIQAFEYALTPADLKQLNINQKKAVVPANKKEETPEQRKVRETKAAVDAGKSVEDWYLSNKPTLLADTNSRAEEALKEALRNIIGQKKNQLHFFEKHKTVIMFFDTTGHISSIYSDNMDTGKLSVPWQQYFSASMPGEVTINKTNRKVPFTQTIYIQIGQKSGDANGRVKLIRNKDKSYSTDIIPNANMDSTYKARLKAYAAGRLMDMKPGTLNNADISGHFETYTVHFRYALDLPPVKTLTIYTIDNIQLN
ncbi:hypothetical protein SAMN05444266_101190 [Chitinophaga jiangningensis]|uniref:Uncharacterized protein n=2 Tax=Chitinophaga jiangningensis TaxID=1419482 RepID=A0A1M6VG84_9BACT|nr:hypothetical protein SAMN05444266_101190 [Chitinophaga jiangningensis]